MRDSPYRCIFVLFAFTLTNAQAGVGQKSCAYSQIHCLSDIYHWRRFRRVACASMRETDLASSRLICDFDQKEDFAQPTGSWPYTSADMKRVDSGDDKYFYHTPRFVTHIDDRAIESLTAFYRDEMSKHWEEKKKQTPEAMGVDVLDLCSSWISHLPNDVPLARIVGVGMNEKELNANPQLTEYIVQDLNQSPSLNTLRDESFDVVCNVVSVDYLTRPLEVFQETHRVLRSGGLALVSFSNRCFPTKAVSMWLQADEIGRLTIVGSYFHYAATWKSIEALDVIPSLEPPKRPSFGEIMKDPSVGLAWASTAAAIAKANSGDPLFVVKAQK